MIKVICHVDGYDMSKKEILTVTNHSIRNELVILIINNKEIFVNADELITAIQNAKNVAKY